METPQHHHQQQEQEEYHHHYGPLGEPIIRKWELSSNSTFYDGSVAAPADDDLQVMWLSWSIIFLVVAIFTTSVILPMALNIRQTRQSPFNLYLIYMMLPDAFMTFACSISCFLNYLQGHYIDSPFACYFQSFYVAFMMTSNMWLNAVVARQVLHMLESSQSYTHYQPPTHRQVTRQALIIYVASTIVGLWGVIPQWTGWDQEHGWFGHKTRLTMGSMCLPQPYNHASTAFFYLVHLNINMFVPGTITLHAFWKLFRGNLLPPQGKRRTLAIYLFRLSVAFVVMWLPTFLLIYLIGPWTNSWIQWIGATWGHLQAAVQALITLWKPDIWPAYIQFYRCQQGYDGVRRRSSTVWMMVSFRNLNNINTKSTTRDHSSTNKTSSTSNTSFRRGGFIIQSIGDDEEEIKTQQQHQHRQNNDQDQSNNNDITPIPILSSRQPEEEQSSQPQQGTTTTTRITIASAMLEQELPIKASSSSDNPVMIVPLGRGDFPAHLHHHDEMNVDDCCNVRISDVDGNNPHDLDHEENILTAEPSLGDDHSDDEDDNNNSRSSSNDDDTDQHAANEQTCS